MKSSLLHHLKKVNWPRSRSHNTIVFRSKLHTVTALFLSPKQLTHRSALPKELRLPAATACFEPWRHMSTCPRSRSTTDVPRTRTGDSPGSRSSSSMMGEVMADMATLEAGKGSIKPFSSIPGPRGLYTIPYIGTTLLFKPFSKHTPEKLSRLWRELHETYGSIIKIRLGGDWLVILEDLNDIEKLLRPRDSTPYRSPVQPDDMYIKRERPHIKSLGSANGEEWRRMRSPLNMRMNRPSSTVHYLSSQEAVAVDFAQWLYRLQASPPQVMQELFFRYAAESIGVVCFNKRLGFLATESERKEDTEKLLQCYKTIIYSIGQATFGKQWLFLMYRDAFYNKYKEAKDHSLSMATQFMKGAMAEVQRKQTEGTLDPDEPNFLLSLLSEETLTLDEVVLMCDGLLMAGSDSTACGLQLFFYALATNPDKQEKLAAELLQEMGPDGSLSPEVLARLSYLKVAVKESMRLYFPIPTGMTRKLPFDITLGGYQIPKGTSIQVSSNIVASSPKYFDQPDAYLPERWLRDEGGQREKTISSLAFLPFGIGPRNCLGQRFAVQEIYLAAAKVLQKYHIGVQDSYGPLETTFTPFCCPDRPLPLTFTERR